MKPRPFSFTDRPFLLLPDRVAFANVRQIMTMQANFQEHRDGSAYALSFSGRLTLAQIGDLPQRLAALSPDDGCLIDLSQVERMDTVGAFLIHRLKKSHNGRITGASDDTLRLIEQVALNDRPVKIRPDARPALARVLNDIGKSTIEALKTLFAFVGFFGHILVALFTIARNPRRFRVNSVVRQFEVVGINALGIIGLMSFLIGIVIAQQGAVQLRQFGAEVFAINLIGRITLRELGVLMTAIMVAGRSGSAFAAQIGSMRLGEEIDAMRTIGVSPMEVLVVPRMLAATILMPVLGFYSSLIAIFGGGLFCWLSLDIPPATFVQRIREVVPITDIWIGLIKAPVFGALIAITGCYQGMQVKGNAEEVGLRTTAAVVQGIFMVIVLDAFFAVFFTSIGWS